MIVLLLGLAVVSVLVAKAWASTKLGNLKVRLMRVASSLSSQASTPSIRSSPAFGPGVARHPYRECRSSLRGSFFFTNPASSCG